ncbi:LOW QUALITY PROTEIN: rab GTPase-activating protein 1-like [Eurytemora carolleeae]|uniref:LOW QUALITY PROTEIN: rab GTPase-activating protein 1-like n=1 Tax=Eurytemora carolleeae TaxID=1294199 RepID=UPI000C766420|nr:LOW QUALITY PROTEIN: rab GTPase-activating protein 1-like [Eurytemora carolleeae]|eukprot:XP_023338421.1 LOW QUALITY PROTEIN: rab GTPase-activating protein 1-like [Eurytemora affinis]
MEVPLEVKDKDLVEVESSDSVPTSEEYEVVKEQSPSPDPGFVGDEKQIEESLKECLEENEKKGEVEMEEDKKAEEVEDGSEITLNNSLTNENLLEDQDHTIFHNIYHLGTVNIGDPKDEAMIQQNMTLLSKECVSPMGVSVSVPRLSSGCVVVRESATRRRVSSIKIHRITYFARGDITTTEKSCFAFTASMPDKEAGHLYQCFVFRCEVAAAVEKIFVNFAKAFEKPKGQGVRVQHQLQLSLEEEEVVFEVGLEIREDDTKGNFVYVPRDKDCFKLKSNVEKRVLVSICQVSDSTKLKVERCFGMLVSPGRNVRHSDMQLLEGVRMLPAGAGWTIQGSWDPREAAFAVLNQETGPDIHSVYMTVAADLVIAKIAEPVRFVIETKARIYPATERYWYYTRRSVVRRFYLSIRGQGTDLQLIEVRKGEELEQQGRISALLASGLASWRGGETLESSSTLEQEDESDTDEPLLSGSGGVSKDCTETELDSWGEVLRVWKVGQPRPKQLAGLVKAGVPEALRGEVWQRLSGASETMDNTIENYKILVTKETPDEKVIFRDIHRTFPAHEFFKEAGGGGQEALYRISKAYSVYDSEIGYCQGQSFLIAALLLQMPEEQSFGVLVQIMHSYGLRDMFRENFEQLQLRFYQLERLVETRLPDLHAHFQEIGLETHMYASQWFLTLFSAKFPLFLVFRVLDVFLLQGVDIIFQVSLALLMMVRKELLQQDFESTMKYFRVNIPKRLRSEDHAKSLMKTVCSITIKKLSKYEKEWRNIKEAERLAENPVTRYERENKKLMADNLRLERENDVLAQQLLTSKISMRSELDKLEDIKETLEKELAISRQLNDELSGEKNLITEEADQLKLVLKRELTKLESELLSKENIIVDYKQITKQLSSKLERKEERGAVKNPSDKALSRVQELELELAQTKLALVETECKNQDLAHQFSTQASSAQNSTWLSKTLTSIKEVTVARSGTDLKKSSSEHTSLGFKRFAITMKKP